MTFRITVKCIMIMLYVDYQSRTVKNDCVLFVYCFMYCFCKTCCRCLRSSIFNRIQYTQSTFFEVFKWYCFHIFTLLLLDNLIIKTIWFCTALPSTDPSLGPSPSPTGMPTVAPSQQPTGQTLTYY